MMAVTAAHVRGGKGKPPHTMGSISGRRLLRTHARMVFCISILNAVRYRGELLELPQSPNCFPGNWKLYKRR